MGRTRLSQRNPHLVGDSSSFLQSSVSESMTSFGIVTMTSGVIFQGASYAISTDPTASSSTQSREVALQVGIIISVLLSVAIIICFAMIIHARRGKKINWSSCWRIVVCCKRTSKPKSSYLVSPRFQEVQSTEYSRSTGQTFQVLRGSSGYEVSVAEASLGSHFPMKSPSSRLHFGYKETGIVCSSDYDSDQKSMDGLSVITLPSFVQPDRSRSARSSQLLNVPTTPIKDHPRRPIMPWDRSPYMVPPVPSIRSSILTNMLTMSRHGSIMLPPSPAFPDSVKTRLSISAGLPADVMMDTGIAVSKDEVEVNTPIFMKATADWEEKLGSPLFFVSPATPEEATSEKRALPSIGSIYSYSESNSPLSISTSPRKWSFPVPSTLLPVHEQVQMDSSNLARSFHPMIEESERDRGRLPYSDQQFRDQSISIGYTPQHSLSSSRITSSSSLQTFWTKHTSSGTAHSRVEKPAAMILYGPRPTRNVSYQNSSLGSAPASSESHMSNLHLPRLQIPSRRSTLPNLSMTIRPLPSVPIPVSPGLSPGLSYEDDVDSFS